MSIWSDKKQGGKLHTFLGRKAMKYTFRSKEKQVLLGYIKGRIGREERQGVVVNKRSRVGDWYTWRFNLPFVFNLQKGAEIHINAQKAAMESLQHERASTE